MATTLAPIFIDRDEFLSERWTYKAGEHVSIISPTGGGKTVLLGQLMGESCTPELPGVMLVMKPRDIEVTRIQKELEFQKVRKWPPPPRLFKQRPPGWLLWPKHSLTDPDADDALMETQFRKAIISSYKKGNRIIIADEVAGLCAELDMEKLLTTIWMRGRSMDCGLWAATQRPVKVPLHMYSQAHHIFLGYDPDKATRDRLREIGGLDPDMIQETIKNLPLYHFMYIRRADRTSCIVGP